MHIFLHEERKQDIWIKGLVRNSLPDVNVHSILHVHKSNRDPLTEWGCLTTPWYESRPTAEINLIQHLLPAAWTMVPFSPYGQTPKGTFWLLPRQTRSPPYHTLSACSLLADHSGGSSCQRVKHSYLHLGYRLPCLWWRLKPLLCMPSKSLHVINCGSALAQIKINIPRTFNCFLNTSYPLHLKKKDTHQKKPKQLFSRSSRSGFSEIQCF